jgi:hypothetical protein
MRFPARSLTPLALPAGLSVLALLTACGGSGSSSPAGAIPGPTGTANILVTDAPSDDWSTIQLQVTKVTLVHQEDHTKEEVAFSGKATINLVDLDSIGELLATAQIPVGNYDQMKVSINTDPTTMSIIPEGSSMPVPPSQIHVVGAGTIPVAISPVLAITSGGSNAVQADFDLSHPLFINRTPTGDVVLNFQLKFRPNPSALHLIQLHRNVGAVTSLDSTANSFQLLTRYGQTLSLKADTNTRFYDADNRPVTAGSFSGLAVSDAVMVASRLQDDGSLYAVRVWSCTATSAANLPIANWSPEGHVVSVNTANDFLVVDNADGRPRTIDIDPDTVFTFQQNTAIGTGQAYLADVRHGFKVTIDVKDPLAVPLHASAVNIQRAVDSGYIDTSTTVATLTYGQPYLGNLRNYSYGPAFSWWDFAQPGTASTSVSDFVAALTGAGTTRVMGTSSLTWDTGTSAWDASTAILEPVRLPVATIAQNYDPSTGTMQVSYTDPIVNSAVTKTIKLTSAAGGGQTLVLKIAWQNGVVTSGLEDPSSWAADLTTSATKVWLSVVPNADGSLSAYSVVVLE